MAGSRPDTIDPGEAMYCLNHPKRETLIRCSKCLDPICTECAVQTPVGLRCPECANAGRLPLYTLETRHYVVATLVALAASLVAGALVPQLGLLFTFFLSAPAGGLVAEAVNRSTGGKRGRALQIITAICIALGAYAGPLLATVAYAGTPLALLSNPWVYLRTLLNATSLLYTVLAIGAAVARLR